jgi:hypothetical protein
MYGRIYRPLGSTPAPTILMPGATGLTAYNATLRKLGYPTATGDVWHSAALSFQEAVRELLRDAAIVKRLTQIGYPSKTDHPAFTAAQHSYLRTLYGFLLHLEASKAVPGPGAPGISKELAEATVAFFDKNPPIPMTTTPNNPVREYIALINEKSKTWGNATTAITPADNAGGSGIADNRPEDEGQGAKETPDFGTGSGTGTNTGDTNRRNPDGTLAVTTQPGERDALARKQAEEEEKKKRRRLYIIVGGGIIATGAAVALVVSMSKPSPKYKPVAALSGVRKKKNKAKKPKPFKL